jgi:ribose transport system substrate-binding protein
MARASSSMQSMALPLVKSLERREMSSINKPRVRLLRRGSSLVALAALGALAMTASAQPSVRHSTGEKAGVSLALILDDLTNPVELPLRKGAEAAAKKYGFSLKIVGPSPNTAQAQIALVQDEVAAKVNGIVMLPVDSSALVPAINAAVDGGVPVATTELDAPTSKRSFFYFGGTPPLQQGMMQADRVAAYEKAHGATGTVNVVVTSCLPTVTGQQDRRKGFEQEIAKLNKTMSFKLKEVAFANTTTDPAKNLSNIQNLYTANGSKMQVAYAMCGPDTQNWGTVLKRANNHNILVAGYDWLPQTLNLIGQGWVAWSLGSSLYDEGFHTFGVMYQHFANGKPLPTGFAHGTSTWATKANLAQVRQSPDVKYAG